MFLRLFDLSAKRDESGKVITQPKNMSICAPLNGKSKSSYFSLLGFTTIGDPYVEAEKRARQDEISKKTENKKDAEFKPASGYKSM